MKIHTFVAAGSLALGLALFVTPGKAQFPDTDRVEVTLPYSVTVEGHKLQPGPYEIREVPTNQKSYALQIYSGDGRQLEASAMTIPALKVHGAEDTKIVLHHFGSDYYFDKIWIQGKEYGYEFPLPAAVKAREREMMQPVTIAARYQAKQQMAAAPPPAEEEAQAPPPEQPEIAEAPPAPAPEAPAPAPAPRRMPHTSAGWLLMLLGGGALSGAGVSLRRRK
jgi:hypothetical protein